MGKNRKFGFFFVQSKDRRLTASCRREESDDGGREGSAQGHCRDGEGEERAGHAAEEEQGQEG
jgi:hypothetical protein